MLVTRLVERIRAGGPMPFDEFMRVALYDPASGYFTSGPVRSEASGDFLTSPEVSPLFGRTLARFVAAESDRCGCDAPPSIIEAGAGTGSLLRPLLDGLAALEVAGPLDVWAVDVSPAARDRLRNRVPEATVVGSLAEVPGDRCGVVVANELLDNLPAALAVRRGRGWAERMVGVRGEGLAWQERPARPAVAAWADRYSGPVAEGAIVEVQLEAGEWIIAAAGILRCGAIALFDYGDTAEGLASRRADGTVRTYRGHHLGPDPLAEPGATDITMDVNVSAAAAVLSSVGAEVAGDTQAAFLTHWGLRAAIRRLREQELALARAGDALERLRVHSDITGAEALLHPRGLGDFRVVVGRV